MGRSAMEGVSDGEWSVFAMKVVEERDALKAECERLTAALKKANDSAEHFEREWYLRGDEVERLRKLAASHGIPQFLIDDAKEKP